MNRLSTQELIRDCGCQVIGVFGTETAPTFSYTIGLTATYGFELIVIGLRPDYATIIFNDIVASLKEFEELKLDVPDDRWANLPVMFKETTDRVRNYVYQADHFYGKPVRVLQMVMSDKNGLLPDASGYDQVYMGNRQTLLYKSKEQLH